MQIVLLSMLVFAGFFVLMSVGVLMGRKPIKGSCGGMSALGMDTACDICGGNTAKCDSNQADALAYDATKQ